MKSATRIIPSLSHPLKNSSSAKPITRTLLSTRSILAGPSTSTSASPRFYATTSTVSPQSLASSVQDNAQVESQQQAEEGEGEGELPSNLNFEELSEEADESINNALGYGDEFSSIPQTRFDPILLPISSLASSTPTLASESDLVVSLPPEIFAQPIRRDILHRCVIWYLSQLRSGTKTTKSRSTVNYSGRKLRPQKGTGMARQGDASSGTRRGGAPIHPIFAKNWAQQLPRKVRSLGLRIALSSKLNSGLLRVVDNLNEGDWRGTNEARRALSDEVIFQEKPVDLEPIISAEGDQTSTESAQDEAQEQQILTRFGPPKDLSILFLYSPNRSHDESLFKFNQSIRNIPGIELLSIEEVQVYHILKYKWLVMESSSIDSLTGLNDLKEELELVPEHLSESGEGVSV